MVREWPDNTRGERVLVRSEAALSVGASRGGWRGGRTSFFIACMMFDSFTFGGGGAMRPQRIWSCFSFSVASRRCVRSFFRSRFVSGSGRGGGGGG